MLFKLPGLLKMVIGNRPLIIYNIKKRWNARRAAQASSSGPTGTRAITDSIVATIASKMAPHANIILYRVVIR